MTERWLTGCIKQAGANISANVHNKTADELADLINTRDNNLAALISLQQEGSLIASMGQPTVVVSGETANTVFTANNSRATQSTYVRHASNKRNTCDDIDNDDNVSEVGDDDDAVQDDDDNDYNVCNDEELVENMLLRNKQLSDVRVHRQRGERIFKKLTGKLKRTWQDLSREDKITFAQFISWDDIKLMSRSKAVACTKEASKKYYEISVTSAMPTLNEAGMDKLKQIVHVDQDTLIKHLLNLPAIIYFKDVVRAINTHVTLNLSRVTDANCNLRHVFRPIPSFWFVQLARLWELTSEQGLNACSPYNMEGYLWRTVKSNWLTTQSHVHDDLTIEKPLKYYALDIHVSLCGFMNSFSTVSYKAANNSWDFGFKNKSVNGFSDTHLLVAFAMVLHDADEYVKLLNGDDDGRWVSNNHHELTRRVAKAAQLLKSSFQQNYRFKAYRNKQSKLLYQSAETTRGGAQTDVVDWVGVPKRVVDVLRQFVIPDLSVICHLNLLREASFHVNSIPNEALYTRTSIGLLLNFDQAAKSLHSLRKTHADVTHDDKFAQDPNICRIYQHLMMAALTISKLHTNPSHEIDAVTYMDRCIQVASPGKVVYVSSMYAFPGIGVYMACMGGWENLRNSDVAGFFKDRKDRVHFMNLFAIYIQLLGPMPTKQYHESTPMSTAADAQARSLKPTEFHKFLNSHDTNINIVATSLINILALPDNAEFIDKMRTSLNVPHKDVVEENVQLQTAIRAKLDAINSLESVYTLPITYDLFDNVCTKKPVVGPLPKPKSDTVTTHQALMVALNERLTERSNQLGDSPSNSITNQSILRDVVDQIDIGTYLGKR